MKKQILLLFAACVTFTASFSQAPTITSFSPASGPVGTLVTIAGTNLSSPTAFAIGGVAAIVVSDNGDTLVGMVMPGAAIGAVSVTTVSGTATGGGSYMVTPTLYPSVQQGPKLVGTGATAIVYQGPLAAQGYGLSISADDNTAVVGGPADNGLLGAAWIFIRSGGSWIQQGNKLVGSGGIGSNVKIGASAALSADGNTAILGGPADSNLFGAAWIFIRTGSTWTQQGPKLVGTGAININTGVLEQGISVAISADGNTAIVGGYGDSSGKGAAWVFVRSGGIWSQQGSKLVGTGAIGGSNQGYSVAISADGNTALIGGGGDNNNIGAAWVFTRAGGIWTQQGAKLVGTGAIGYAAQGFSVSLSPEGNTAILGGPYDNNDTGAVWVFTRSGSVWTQQGSKLFGTGGVYGPLQGSSTSLSADGKVALVGGPNDNLGRGAAWVFSRSGGIWSQRGPKLVGSGVTYLAGIGGSAEGTSVSLAANGSTGIIGGPHDGNNHLDSGAAWIFVNIPCSSDSSSLSQSICQGDTLTLGGSTFTTSGNYFVILTNIGGCDSIVTLHLTVKPLSHDTISQSICANDSVAFGGNIYRTGGYYSQTLTGSNGCDSIVTLHLTVMPSFSDTLYDTICSGTAFTFAGHSLTLGGTYTDTLHAISGCDSTVILHLTVNPLPVVTLNWQALVQEQYLGAILNEQDTIWCSTMQPIFALTGGMPAGGVYTGGYIRNDSLDLYNWNSQTPKDTVYYVYTDSNGCSAEAVDAFGTGLCTSGINDINPKQLISLHPNPNTGTFTLETTQQQGTIYTITDMLGRIILQQPITSDRQQIDMGAAPAGIYTLAISGASGMVKFAVLR